MREPSGRDGEPASHPVPQPRPRRTQRSRGAGAEIAGHEVNAEAPVLAGLGGALVHIILTVVPGVASWTLQRCETGTSTEPGGDTDNPQEDTEMAVQKDIQCPTHGGMSGVQETENRHTVQGNTFRHRGHPHTEGYRHTQ